MDGSNLVFTVLPVVIPLVLAIGVALPFVAERDTARAFSPFAATGQNTTASGRRGQFVTHSG